MRGPIGLLFVATMLASEIGSLTAQPLRFPTSAEQETLFNEMLKAVRAAVTRNTVPINQPSAYKKVRTRLFGCSLMYGVIAKRPGMAAAERDWFLMGAELYPRVAFALNDTGGSLKSEIETANFDLSQNWTERETFLFLRACQDFSNPDMAPSAIMDVMLK